MVPLDDIQRAARALGERGLDAAGRGDIHEARRLLLESTELSDDDPRYLKALGYCAFSVGDIGAAYHAWRKAELLLGGRGSLPWVRSLEHGILRVTVDRYNSAITLARQGKHRDAVNMLDRVLQEVPDFVPAGKAKGLSLLALEDRVGAHKTWTAHRELVRDDPELERLITALNFREATPPPVAVAPSAAAAEPVAAGRPFPTRAAAAVAAIIILGAIGFWPRKVKEGKVDTAAAAQLASSASVAPTPVVITPEESLARVKTPPPSQRSSFSARYHRGEQEVNRGNWPRAIAYLGPIGEFGSREPYHDHVLALLAQSYASTGRAADARRTAWMLVQKYPNSRYITPELRQMAGTGQEHEK